MGSNKITYSKIDYLKQRSKSTETGCIVWIANKDKDGYGIATYKNEDWVAHRLAYSVFNNITKKEMNGLVVCHKCDNPSCINPEHLFLGTHRDNMLDRDVKKRQATGERNGNSKLTDKQRAEIIQKYGSALITTKARGRRKDGQVTYMSVGKLYGVSDTAIRRIVEVLK